MKYERLEQLLDEAKPRVHNDWDYGILVTGAVGTGKSTIAAQALKYLDATFGVDRIHFTIDVALKESASTPRFGAWLLDEAHISGRKAMYGEIQRLNDYLQVSRGLNHFWALCFHQARRVDKPIMERVAVNFHIPRRGIVQIRVLKKNYEQHKEPWRVIAAFKFGPNSGKEWAKYLAKKDAHMRRLQEGAEETQDPRLEALSVAAKNIKAAL